MVALAEERNVPVEKGEDFAIHLAKFGTNIHRGAFLGWDGASKFVRPFVDGDVLAGVAMESLDSTTLVSGEEQPVQVLKAGRVQVPVAGLTDDSDHGATVYITDDQTASLTDTGTDTVLGQVKKVLEGALDAVVRFTAS